MKTSEEVARGAVDAGIKIGLIAGLVAGFIIGSYAVALLMS